MGHVKEIRGKFYWVSSVFTIDYFDVAENNDPHPNDVYRVYFISIFGLYKSPPPNGP